MPEVAEKLANTGSGEPSLISTEELVAMMDSDYKHYGDIIRESGFKIDN